MYQFLLKKVSNVAIFLGTNGNDNLVGSSENDTLTGYLGNDFLVGGIGNDYCLEMRVTIPLMAAPVTTFSTVVRTTIPT